VTPEGKIKAAVKKELDRYPNHYREMPVPGGFGKSGLDFTICFFGKFMAVETKAPGGKPTPRQEERIREIKAAGGVVIVVDTIEQAQGELRAALVLLSAP
jgi:hypothetical protein